MGRLLIQFPGSTNARVSSETLPKNTIVIDEENKQLRLHDGVTPGGFPIGDRGGEAPATTDLDNLTSTGRNIANWSSNVSNCITEIPQDIKLELNNGTLTLKAGSKVYVPNGKSGGENVFDEITITNDLTTTSNANTQLFVVYRNGSLTTRLISNASSGTTNTNAGQAWNTWYDTTNNITHTYGSNGTTDGGTCSLPVAIVTASGSQITSIDQVFNGFGYIGSTMYVLPGVQALVPNGRNPDGTLKNTLVTKPSVNVFTPSSATFSQVTNIALGGTLSYHTFTYDEVNNKTSASGYMNAGDVTWRNGKITSFNPKTAFHAVDFNTLVEKQDKATALNYDNISNCITQISQDINLTLSNGTLTLKAGSKVYVPNGSGVFDAVVIPSDKTFSTGSANNKLIAFYYPGDGTIKTFLPANVVSGSSYSISDGIWYDTTNNVVKRIYGGNVNYSGLSFPICILKSTNGTISSIEQVFNGFGYIGSTIFVLPGLKALAPNGHNADGTLKSAICARNTVGILTREVSSNGYTFALKNDGSITVFYHRPYEQEEYPGDNYRCWYKPSENKIYNTQTGQGTETQIIGAPLFFFNATNGDYNPKQVFHAADYNDYAMITSNTKPITASDALNSIVTTVNKSKSTTGYFKLGNGLIVQWMTLDWDGSYTTLRNWATAFSAANSYMAVAGWGNTQTESAYPVTVREQTTTGVYLQVYTGLANQGRKITVIAIGY